MIRSFEVGDLVMARDFRTVNKRKWIEAKISSKLGKTVYLCGSEIGEIKRHANQLIRRTELGAGRTEHTQRSRQKVRIAPDFSDASKINVDNAVVLDLTGPLLGGNIVETVSETTLPARPGNESIIPEGVVQENTQVVQNEETVISPPQNVVEQKIVTTTTQRPQRLRRTAVKPRYLQEYQCD